MATTPKPCLKNSLHQTCKNKLETCSCLILDFLEELHCHRVLVLKDSCIFFFPDLPTNEDDDRTKASPCHRRCVIHVVPSTLYRVCWHLGGRTQLFITQPYCNALPDTPSIYSGSLEIDGHQILDYACIRRTLHCSAIYALEAYPPSISYFGWLAMQKIYTLVVPKLSR
jgi:hypothetical protein